MGSGASNKGAADAAGTASAAVDSSVSVPKDQGSTDHVDAKPKLKSPEDRLSELQSRAKEKDERNAPGSREFTVTLTKRGKYGLKLAQKAGGYWRVVEVTDDGSVAQFNREHPDQAIRANDLLIKIDGEAVVIAKLEQAQEGASSNVTFVRVPRPIAPPPFAGKVVQNANNL
eukprot:TRINITY_DN6012_c0_g1_i1.p1 TRINITY_DN6012_c0_g1~~TRINITY_DN6012_c0_g1_i1.p1  ORF type:complete len:172 (-),score=40.76 TRINITY_DN6012_c0_g1_i1:177-692(-)